METSVTRSRREERDENDDVFVEINSPNDKQSNAFKAPNRTIDDLTKLSPIPWSVKSRPSSNSSNPSSRFPSFSSQNSLSPFRRLSLSSSSFISSSSIASTRRSSLMGSLEVIFDSLSPQPQTPLSRLTFLGQIYRSTLEKLSKSKDKEL